MSKPTGRTENRGLNKIIFLLGTEGSPWITSTTCTRLTGTVSSPILDDTSMVSVSKDATYFSQQEQEAVVAAVTLHL